ncbi:MarR family winged helix-turn-helix transcriptional regulator [Marinactinospora rubrisoli]|uniref:MarR family winged helix-turn-helix transcriptional regulator n=1 Tax=Marinactinospora rubrisoli TaxID=2715399 RepID=A0ABW2KK16_9ACTN
MTTPEPQAASERELCALVDDLSRQIGDHERERAVLVGLTRPQANALRELTGPLTMRELADRTGCEPSNTTFVIDRLEGQGLVERRPHPTDRRAKQLVLTPAGVELRARLVELFKQDSPLAQLTGEEQRMLRGLLERALRRR